MGKTGEHKIQDKDQMSVEVKSVTLHFARGLLYDVYGPKIWDDISQTTGTIVRIGTTSLFVSFFPPFNCDRA